MNLRIMHICKTKVFASGGLSCSSINSRPRNSQLAARLEQGLFISTGWPDEAARRWLELIQKRDSPSTYLGSSSGAMGEWLSAPT